MGEVIRIITPSPLDMWKLDILASCLIQSQMYAIQVVNSIEITYDNAGLPSRRLLLLEEKGNFVFTPSLHHHHLQDMLNYIVQ